MKKLLLIAILMLAMVITVVACDKPDDPTTETTDAVEETTAAPAPETDAPETEAPETEAPETEAPETDAPETEAPETEAPETEPPKKAAYPEIEGLIAYLPLDKKASNKIESDIDSKRAGNPEFNAGYKGAAYSTGANGYLTLGENWKPGTDSFSASMWFKGASDNGFVLLISIM